MLCFTGGATGTDPFDESIDGGGMLLDAEGGCGGGGGTFPDVAGGGGGGGVFLDAEEGGS